MKPADRYFRWVEWSDEDQCYIGRCPDLFFGGCHGNDRAEVYTELCRLVEEAVADFESSDSPLPPAQIRPMRKVA
ncbi:MAG: pilus assembly protein HicB [Verrucomicrobiae bacterium]|nr:pilus assembly protein HicB [Verrucomicrobiae bacterium]MCP5551379.1 pilus assembly protein HicB [Akkermansiaceae bacterium]